MLRLIIVDYSVLPQETEHDDPIPDDPPVPHGDPLPDDPPVPREDPLPDDPPVLREDPLPDDPPVPREDPLPYRYTIERRKQPIINVEELAETAVLKKIKDMMEYILLLKNAALEDHIAKLSDNALA
ncbi:uncharacterized protein HD556DRAFT_1444511 [Suillus plorans]|uniref:Uncharacterized protein n=1 Tax=Suillus plorans TaxID=116603 RepID=A0A9P7APK7_9AGAM|nr:uncharacterized protein HD556DRAFT_1444511 [Suillus plorans]KAG1792517.1 hypothetical protein HD556DRAFT_1444511 [Suillus plorans]